MFGIKSSRITHVLLRSPDTVIYSNGHEQGTVHTCISPDNFECELKAEKHCGRSVPLKFNVCAEYLGTLLKCMFWFSVSVGSSDSTVLRTQRMTLTLPAPGTG